MSLDDMRLRAEKFAGAFDRARDDPQPRPEGRP
jgi:hypothetical protein